MTRMTANLCLAIFALAALSACTTINVVPREGMALSELEEHTYVGVTRLRLPATRGNVQAADVKTLGAGWQSGPFLGWNASNLVTANPADCQLLIVVRSPAQAENAEKIISSLEGQNPCIVDYTKE